MSTTARRGNAKAQGRKVAKSPKAAANGTQKSNGDARDEAPPFDYMNGHAGNGHAGEAFDLDQEVIFRSGVSLDGTAHAGELAHLDIGTISPSPWNPRKRFEGIESLAASIQAKGLVSPLVVRPTAPGSFMYELVAGERRLRACRQAGVKVVPCLVRDINDSEARELIVTENLQRDDLHPLEEAAGVESLLVAGETIETVAKRLGRSREWVARRSRLLNLTKRWRALIDSDDAPKGWEVGHYELIARLPADAQDALVEKDGSLAWWIGNLVTVRELEQKLDEKLHHRLASAPWDLTDPKIVPRMGACATCPHRASQQPRGLFDLEGPIEPALDRCLLASCWEAKSEKHLARLLKDALAEHGEKLIIAADGYEMRQKHSDAVGTYEFGQKFERAKKDDPKALPVLWLDGKSANKITWVKRKPKYAAAGGGSAPRAKQSAEESLAVKREKAERERAKMICLAVAEAAEKILVGQKQKKPEPITTPDITVVAALAAIWGSVSNDWMMTYPPFKKCRCDADRSHVLMQSHTADVERALWIGVLETIWDELRCCQQEEELKAAKLFGPLLGLDMDAIEAKALEEWPDPKPAKRADQKTKRPAKVVQAEPPTEEPKTAHAKTRRREGTKGRTKTAKAKPGRATEPTEGAEENTAPVPEAWLCKVDGDNGVHCVLAREAGDSPVNAASIAYFRATDDFVVGVPADITAANAKAGHRSFQVSGKKGSKTVHLIPSTRKGKETPSDAPTPEAPSSAEEAPPLLKTHAVLRPGYGIRTVAAATAEEAVATVYAWFRGLKRPPAPAEVRATTQPNGDLVYDCGEGVNTMRFSVATQGGQT